MKKTIGQHAVDVLRETGNPAVMWGDAGLLDAIFYRAFVMDHPPPPQVRWQRVLNGLERSAFFEKRLELIRWGKRGCQECRVFTLKPDTQDQ